MDSRQLESILFQNKFTQGKFLGVFPSDQLPKKIQNFPCCFIANVDPSEEPGSHWVAFYVSSSLQLEFFDSYGNSPEAFPGPIYDYTNHFPRVEFNTQPLQSISTVVCGHYCVYYLYSKCRGLSLKHVQASFVTNHISNDVKVYNFVTHVFRIRTPFYQ